MSKSKREITTMNEAAVDLFDEMLEMDELLQGLMVETELGPTIFDLGIKAQGSFLAGEYIIQVSMGGLAEVSLGLKSYLNDLALPTVTTISNYPVEATMGSQFAGWPVAKDNYHALGSGPARILAKKPKHIYDILSIKDEYHETVLILESNQFPPDSVLKYIAEKCNISLDGLCIILVPTNSIAGTTQIAGRSIETAIHKLMDLGMDITSIITGIGSSPIAPLSNDVTCMLGRTNDMLIYGAEVFLQVEYKNDLELEKYVKKAVSSNSNNYGQLFSDIVKEVKGDFYKIDSAFFAPAKLVINNIHSGKTYSAGNINVAALKRSIQ